LSKTDIRQLDFRELRRAGYRGAVFDKDNCLTIPHEDQLVPVLKEAWKECRETFGDGNVLVVSNSAGTRLDPGELQAESVSYHLAVPVLRHRSFKPSYSCISAIRKYFGSLPSPIRDDELIIVGDRIFTDVVLANRMARRSPSISTSGLEKNAQGSEKDAGFTRTGPLAVWTEGVWERESMLLRSMEKTLLRNVQRLLDGKREFEAPPELARFVRHLPPTDVVEKPSVLSRLWGSLRGAT